MSCGRRRGAMGIYMAGKEEPQEHVAAYLQATMGGCCTTGVTGP
jgi:hypothetical protein